MPVSNNLVETTSTSTGTGGFSLSNVTGRQNFAEAFPTGTGGSNVFWYGIANRDVDEWEIGSGAYIASSLRRQTILASSNSNNRVTFSAGTKDVTSDIPYSLQLFSGIANIPVGTDGVYPVTNKQGTLGKPANLFNAAYLASEGLGLLFGLGATIARPAGTNPTLTTTAAWAPSAADGAALGTVALPWADVFVATHGSDAAGIRWGTSSITCATNGALNKTGSLRYTAANDGTPTNGTYTVPDAGGDVRTIVNGASTLKIAPQTQNGAVVVFMENSATPAAVTATGDYDLVSGDSFTTATGDDFVLHSTVVNGRSILIVHDATNNIT